jgi:hypothetical protein
VARLLLAGLAVLSVLGLYATANAGATAPSLARVARCLRAAHWKAMVTNADGAHLLSASTGGTTWMIAVAYGKFNELPTGHPATATQRATIARCTR